MSGTIRFVLDGEVVEVEDVEPTRTVLQFLREDLGRTGTKEGCAEGDCGACTVVLAELDRSGSELTLRAINSCIQFLPTLDGKELITVESLHADSAGLHPVQQAMVDCHGSQCGFCTPGFVMSLFALYKSQTEPSRRDIDDALAGNLCRCTGYRPIIAAAKAMYDTPASDDDWLRQPFGSQQTPTERIERLRSVARQDALCVRHNGHEFLAPRAHHLGKYALHCCSRNQTVLALAQEKPAREPDCELHQVAVEKWKRVRRSVTRCGCGHDFH